MSQVFRRRLIREKVLQVLYAYELNNADLQNQINIMFADVTEEIDKKFGLELINKVILHKEEFDEKITKRLSNWEMSRIALIDKLLLRMGLCELFYFPDIPPKVSINEAIEIAKQYSTAGSGKFINGVLDAILNEAKKEGSLQKIGRGLVEESIHKKIQKNN